MTAEMKVMKGRVHDMKGKADDEDTPPPLIWSPEAVED